MANDLRVVLGLDYSQYQQGMQSSIAMNARFGASAKSMAAQIKAAQTNIRNANLHAPGNAGFDSQQRVIRRQSVADLATQQAVTRQLIAESQDVSLQATRASIALEKMQQEAVNLSTANAQLATSMSSVEANEAALAITTQKLAGQLLSLRSSNEQAAAAMKSGEVSVIALESAYQNVVATALKSRAESRNLLNTQAALNQAYRDGAITQAEYQSGIEAVNAALAAQAGKGKSATSALASQMQAAQEAIRSANRMRPGNAEFDGNQRLIRTQAVADLAEQKAATRQLTAEYNDSSLQATRSAASTQKLNQEVISLATENRQLAGSLSSTTSQKLALAATTQRLTGTVLSLRAANAQGIAALNSSKVSALSLEHAYQEVISAAIQSRMQTRNLANTQQALNQALKVGAITQAEYAEGMARAAAATGAKTMSAGRAQVAISQMIYAVDDAATVYGTAGLAGSVRAASNNLTMMAGLLGGPVALGISVAVAAAVQLYLAFDKGGDAAESASKKADKYTDALNRQLRSIERMIDLRRELNAAEERGTTSVGEVQRNNQDELEKNKAKRDFVQSQIDERDRKAREIRERQAKRAAQTEHIDEPIYQMGYSMDGAGVPGVRFLAGLGQYMSSAASSDRESSATLQAELVTNEEEKAKLIQEQNDLLKEQAEIQKSMANSVAQGWGNISAFMKSEWTGITAAAQQAHSRFMENNRDAAATLAKRHTETRNAINDPFLSQEDTSKRLDDNKKRKKELWDEIDKKTGLDKDWEDVLSGKLLLDEYRRREKKAEVQFKPQLDALDSERALLESGTAWSNGVDPSKKRAIAETLKSRLADIDSMQETPEEKRKLKERAKKLAARDLANESSEGATTGPSGFEKGGKEAAEIMRRAMLAQRSQKDKSEHYLQIIQDEIKKLNQTAEKERAAVEKMVKNTPTPIKLTP